MNIPKQYIKSNEENAIEQTIKLTPEQVQLVQKFADDVDITFKNMAMILIQCQLTDIGRAFAKDMAAKKLDSCKPLPGNNLTGGWVRNFTNAFSTVRLMIFFSEYG